MEEIKENEIIETEIEEQKFYLLGIELTAEEYDFFMVEQSKGKQLFIEDGKVVAKEPIISQEDVINNKILKLKSNLDSTDYIVLKIAEAETDEEKQSLRELYAEELKQRKLWRDEINELEKQLEGESLWKK